MTQAAASIDEEEVAKFAAMAGEWWDPRGAFRPLHQINPLRIGFIRDEAMKLFHVEQSKVLPLQGLSVLDVGCGGGLLCEPMARLGAEVTGIDASEKNIAIARTHAEQSGVPVQYRAASAEALAAEGRQFDVVLTMEVLEHVADVASFMQAACALVRPGGMLVAATLNRTFKSYAMAIVGAEYVLRWLPRGTHDWSKFLKPSEIVRHLEREGLAPSELCGMVFHPLTGEWSLSKMDLGVNYLLSATKRA